MAKERKSNIELLRIISIFLILVVHATYYSFGTPTIDEIQINPVRNFFYIGIENVSVVCVDVFVLISGWFGVHPKFKSIGGLFFQCIYFNVLMCLFGNVTNLYSVSSMDYMHSFVHFPHFVMCYTVMYMLTPMINAFIEHSSKKEFRRLLFVYYSWAFVFGWFFHSDEGFINGNTALAFIGLYMLARYVRLYVSLPPPICKACIWMFVWCANILIVTAIVWGWAFIGLNEKVGNILINMSTSYLAPNVIFASLSLLLCFSYMDFSSKIINKIAISAFAAVLVHGFHMDEIFKHLVRDLYESNLYAIFLLEISLLIVAYMVFSVVMDKGRIYLWNKLHPLFSSVLSKLELSR